MNYRPVHSTHMGALWCFDADAYTLKLYGLCDLLLLRMRTLIWLYLNFDARPYTSLGGLTKSKIVRVRGLYHTKKAKLFKSKNMSNCIENWKALKNDVLRNECRHVSCEIVKLVHFYEYVLWNKLPHKR